MRFWKLFDISVHLTIHCTRYYFLAFLLCRKAYTLLIWAHDRLKCRPTSQSGINSIPSTTIYCSTKTKSKYTGCFLDTQVSLAPTHVSWSVSKSVTLSDFNRYLSNGRSNQTNSKNKVHFFLNFASGKTLPTQSTGPQPIQLVPKHWYLSIGRSNQKKSNEKVEENELAFLAKA